MYIRIYQKSKLAFAFLTLLLVTSLTLAVDTKQSAHAQSNIETYQVSIHSSGTNAIYAMKQLVNVLIPPDSSVISYDLVSTNNVYVTSFQYQGCFSMRYLKFAQAYVDFMRSPNAHMDGDFSVKVTVSRNTVPYSPCINDNLADKIIERLNTDPVSVSWEPWMVFTNLGMASDWKGYPILSVQKIPGFTLPPNKVDYLVITSAEMQPYASSFLLWKKEQGLGTFVETIENINTVYIGDTIQSKTVEFLKDAFDTWHMTYVLIVGNVGILPPLYYQIYNCSVIGGMTDTVSTDYCYMALEQNVSALCYDENVGIKNFSFPDFILGRFPFDDPTQVQTLFQKTIAYENNTDPGKWARTNLVVFGQGVGPDPAPLVNSSNERPCISLQYGENLTLAGLVDYINNGVGSVFLWNHANPSSWWLGGNEYFDINAAQSLSNTRLPIIFSEGCFCGKWDVGSGGSDSVAVKLLGMSGGAVAIVGGPYYSPLGDDVFLSAYNYWKSEYGIHVPGNPDGLPGSDYGVGKAFFYLNALTGAYPRTNLLGDPSIVLATANYDVPKEILVVRGLDNSIYRRFQAEAGWQDWMALSGSTLDSPAFARLGNQMHFVVRGSDGTSLWDSYTMDLMDPSSFSGWTLLRGATPSEPTLTSNGTVLCLVVRGEDNSIYYRCYNGSWGSWFVVPTGATPDSPAAAMLGNDLHIVVRGMDGGSLWDAIISCDGTVVRGWKLVSGATASKPVLACSGSDNLWLVVRGMDNAIYYRNYTGSTDSWGDWSTIPTGATPDGPGATVVGNVLCTVVRGMDGNSLWWGDIDLGTSNFIGWTLLSGATPSAPTLTS